jgi:hypothetical protein
MKTNETARSWLASVARQHLPSNTRNYKFSTYCGQQNFGSFIGLPVDLSPAEGKVVDISDEWLLVKTRRNTFFIADVELLSQVPGIGDTVVIEPWARKGFDGLRLDAPRDSGGGCKTFILGETRSRFPNRSDLQCPQLRDMLDQLEVLKMPDPDGIRTVAQVMIDAGASNHPVEYCDPADSDIISNPPRVTVTLDAPHIPNGPVGLSVIYDRGGDMYRVETVSASGEVTTLENLTFDMLPETIGEIATDPAWRKAKVAIIKKAGKALAKSA